MIRRLALIGVLATSAAGIPIAAQLPVRDTPAQPTTGVGVISGIVTTDDRVPQPMRRARVTLNSVNRSIPGRTDTTDDAGRFVFRDLPAGQYQLAANKPGFVRTNYGARRPDRPGTPLAVADGQPVTGITLRLARGGVLTGNVRDSSGQPVPGVTVDVLRYSFSAMPGERTLVHDSISSFGRADDRGTYRVWGLPPGDYIVMVTPTTGGRGFVAPGLEEMRRLTTADVDRAIASARSGAPGPARPADTRSAHPELGAGVTYSPVFHPGVTDLAAATTVTLAPGEEREGIDVVIELLPTARINGTMKLAEGVPPQPVAITLVQTGTQAQTLGSAGAPGFPTTRPDRDGRFAFAGVAPGRYTITAKTGATAGQGAGLGAAGPSWWAMTNVAIDGRDVDVALELQPSITIKGRMVYDGVSPPPQNLSATRIFLVPPGSGGNLGAGPSGQVDAQGRFEITGVTPGTYSPVGIGSSNLVVKSSLVNGRDALDSAAVEIKPSENNVEWVITYGDQPTELSGTLQDATGRAATDYFVVVFTTDRSYWTPRSRRVRSTRPATDGKFSMIGLPPGDYFIAALTDFEPVEMNDATFLAGLVNASIKVTLTEGQRTTQDLKLSGGGT